MAKNPFRDVLESEEAAAPAAAGRNPFRQRVQQIDAAASTFDAGRQYDRDMNVAVETGQPMAVVEPFGPEIGFEIRTLKRLTTVADPSDVGDLPQDRRIGLREQISRMVEGEWLKRVPFSPLPMQEAVDIYEASQRVKTNSYADVAEKEVRMSEALLYPGSGRAVNPEPGFAAQERAQRLKTVEDAWRARDAAKIEKYIHERIELAERGQTFGAKVFDGVSYLPSWMIEFAMTGGMAQIGSEAARGAVLKTLQGYAKTAAGRTLLTGAGWTGGAITRATLGLPLRVGDEIVERRIDHIAVGPNGELSIATPAESWATSILKGWGSVAIEAGSETAGAEILKPLAKLGASQIRRLPFGSRLYDGMRQAYLAIHPEPGAAANFAQRFFTRAGYDGLVEELGEERVATILNGLVGTEDFGAGPDAGPLERIRAGLSQDLQPGNLAVEAAVLAVPGAAKAAAGAATRGFTTEAQRAQSPEGAENIGQGPPAAANEGGQPAGTGPAQPETLTQAAPAGTMAAMAEPEGVGREKQLPPTPERPGGTIRPEIADLLDKLNRNVISKTWAKKEAKRLGLHDDFLAARAASRKPKESPETLADRRESQRLAAEKFDAKVQQYRADNPDDATVVAADPSGQLYLDMFGEEWIENTRQWREGVIEDDKQQAINEAEDAKELERTTEEHYQQSKAMADTKTAATKRVMDVAESLGWKVTHVNWGYSGFGSQYVQIESPDGEQIRTVRVSDHVAPMGAGFNQEKQEYYDRPDADFVLDDPGQLIDEAELRKTLESFDPSPRSEGAGDQAPAASERDPFQGPQYFTYEDYAAKLPGDPEQLRQLARSLGVSTAGTSSENLAPFVGGAIEAYTAKPEPAPMIEGEPHPGAMTYPQFFERYGLALAEHRKNPEQAAWLARYGNEQISGPRGLYRALQEEWRAIQAWDWFYKLTGQERPEGAATSAPPPASDEPRATSDEVVDWPRTEAEAREIQSEQDSIDTQADLAEFFGQPPAADLPAAVAQEPTPAEAGFIRRMLHKFGIKSLDGYEPISNKDLSRFWRYVQLPFDIARSFPQFAPVFGVQRARELAKQVLDRAFAEKLKPYFDLDTRAQKAVDELLIAQEQYPGGEIVGKLLAQLTPQQYAAYTAIRDGLDDAARILVERMRELGVPEERIAEFEARIGSYIPHKWYGPWAVVVKEKGPDGRTRTAYMTAVHTKDRFTERDRLLKMFPGATVDIIRRTKMEYETFQDAPSWAVNKMLDVIAEQAEKQAQKAGKPYDPSTADAMRQAFKDLYKAKGFGMHFIKRAETPGWTADLRLPLAEYFAGLSGFLTKMEAAMAFTEAMEGIDPQKTPRLHRYASEYIRYVMGDQFEWGRLKSVMYLWYLFGNIKSAVVNVSGNLMMGWPELSKRTRWSAAKLMTAMADTAAGRTSQAERDFIAALESQGYLDAKMTSEISARGGNAILRMAWGPVGKAASFADVFRHMERLNRTSMAVALHRAGVTDVAEAAGIIDTAHFHYAKGNRPPLMRGGKSALTIFRSYTLNQLTWMKNQAKAGEWGALGRHMLAWTLTGGLKAMPLAGLATAIYVGATGRDPEEDMADLIGKTPAEILMRGLPTQAGVSLTGSVAMSDLVPELDPDKDLQWQVLDWMGGVVSDIPGRLNRVGTDLKNRQYLRALEDASPEALRNPLAAWRLYSEGHTTRRGSPLIDFETFEQIRLNGLDAALKAMGFQPDQIPRAYEKQKLAERVGADRAAIKQQWVDRFYLAHKIGDIEGMREVIAERAEHEAAMREQKRPLLVVSEKEIAEGVKGRMDPANMPKGDTLRAYLSLYRRGEKKQE